MLFRLRLLFDYTSSDFIVSSNRLRNQLVSKLWHIESRSLHRICTTSVKFLEVRMSRAGKSRDYLEEFQPPRKKLAGLGDELIKELARKQGSTKTSLQEQLSIRKEFEKVADFVPITSYQSGQCSLGDLEHASDFAGEIERLKAAGLTDDDVRLYFESRDGFEAVAGKRPKHETGALRDRLQYIETALAQHQTKEIFQRLQTDEERPNDLLAEKPNSTETKLLKFAMSAKDKSGERLQHPMNNLPDLLSDINDRVYAEDVEKVAQTIRTKARKLGRRVHDKMEDLKMGAVVEKPTSKSKWDVRTAEEVKAAEVKTYGCSKREYYTVRNGEIVRLENAERVFISTDKLSVEEIKEIPRFQDYRPGEPNKVLYLKNLHGKVSEANLRYLLKCNGFEDGYEIKLMTGRMKGQAFVTFTDEQQSTLCLNKILGLLINDKPLIVQYGKRNG